MIYSSQWDILLCFSSVFNILRPLLNLKLGMSVVLQVFGHKTKVLDALTCWPDGGARWKIRGSPKSVGFIVCRPWMCVQDFIVIHPTVVTDISVWAKVVDRQANIALWRGPPLNPTHSSCLSFIAQHLSSISNTQHVYNVNNSFTAPSSVTLHKVIILKIFI